MVLMVLVIMMFLVTMMVLALLIMVTMIVLIQPTLQGSEMRCLNLSSAPQICSSDSNGISPHTWETLDSRQFEREIHQK